MHPTGLAYSATGWGEAASWAEFPVPPEAAHGQSATGWSEAASWGESPVPPETAQGQVRVPWIWGEASPSPAPGLQGDLAAGVGCLDASSQNAHLKAAAYAAGFADAAARMGSGMQLEENCQSMWPFSDGQMQSWTGALPQSGPERASMPSVIPARYGLSVMPSAMPGNDYSDCPMPSESYRRPKPCHQALVGKFARGEYEYSGYCAHKSAGASNKNTANMNGPQHGRIEVNIAMHTRASDMRGGPSITGSGRDCNVSTDRCFATDHRSFGKDNRFGGGRDSGVGERARMNRSTDVASRMHETVDVIVDGAKYCADCETWLNGSTQFKDHEGGKKHRKSVEKWRQRGDATPSNNQVQVAAEVVPVVKTEVGAWLETGLQEKRQQEKHKAVCVSSDIVLKPPPILPRPPPTALRIFVLGMPKTATTSLHEAFESIGLKSVHWALNVGLRPDQDRALCMYGKDSDHRLVCACMRRAAKESNQTPSQGILLLDRLPPDITAIAQMDSLVWTDAKKQQVLADFPQMDYDGIVKSLVKDYPGAKFILNIRDMNEWLKSVDNHNDMRQRLIRADLAEYGLPVGIGVEDKQLSDWVEKHWKYTKRKFEEWAQESKEKPKEWPHGEFKVSDKLLELKIDENHEHAKKALQDFLYDRLPIDGCEKKEVMWEVHNAASSRRRRGRMASHHRD